MTTLESKESQRRSWRWPRSLIDTLLVVASAVVGTHPVPLVLLAIAAFLNSHLKEKG